MQLQMPSRPPIARARAPSKGTSATCSIITDWPLGMRTLMATTVRAALSKAGIMELSRRESWKTRNADAATTSVPAIARTSNCGVPTIESRAKNTYPRGGLMS